MTTTQSPSGESGKKAFSTSIVHVFHESFSTTTLQIATVPNELFERCKAILMSTTSTSITENVKGIDELLCPINFEASKNI